MGQTTNKLSQNKIDVFATITTLNTKKSKKTKKQKHYNSIKILKSTKCYEIVMLHRISFTIKNKIRIKPTKPASYKR